LKIELVEIEPEVLSIEEKRKKKIQKDAKVLKEIFNNKKEILSIESMDEKSILKNQCLGKYFNERD
jgi:hypothetical protein